MTTVCFVFRAHSQWHNEGKNTIESSAVCYSLNTLRPRQMDAISQTTFCKCIFLNENVWIPIQIWLRFVPKGPINNIPAMVQIMAWRRPGDKPLSEPMMVSLPTHICVARPQWVNTFFICHSFSEITYSLFCINYSRNKKLFTDHKNQ